MSWLACFSILNPPLFAARPKQPLAGAGGVCVYMCVVSNVLIPHVVRCANQEVTNQGLNHTLPIL